MRLRVARFSAAFLLIAAAMVSFLPARAAPGDWTDTIGRVGDPGNSNLGGPNPGVPNRPATLLSGPNCAPHCGKVLIVGGGKEKLYNPQSELFQEAAPLLPVRYSPASVLLDDGRVLVTSGERCSSGDPDPNRRCTVAPQPLRRPLPPALYDPASGWSTTADTSTPHMTGAQAVVLRGSGCASNCGKVLLIGGSDLDENQFFAAELFDPADPTRGWRYTNGTCGVAGRQTCFSHWTGFTLTVLPSGKVLVAAGGASELFDPATETFTPTKGQASPLRSLHSAVLLDRGNCGTNCGKVLAIGGYRHLTDPTAELYDPESDQWTPTAPMSVARAAPAVVLDSGKVLVAGGFSCPAPGASTCSRSLQTAELYDPALGTWSLTSLMRKSRVGHSLTLLGAAGGGKVLAAGGFTYPVGGCGPPPFLPCGPADPAELYEPTNLPPPAVTAIAPSQGPTAGGTPIVVTGSGFGTAKSVRFDDTVVSTPCPATGGSGTSPCFKVISDVQLVVYSPAVPAPVRVHVTVEAPGGISATSPADQFEYIAGPAAPAPGTPGAPGPPTVTGLFPTSGPLAGGTKVLVAGTGLDAPLAVHFGATTVAQRCVGGAPGPTGPCLIAESPTRITVYSPAVTTAARVHVRVQTLLGTSEETAADEFTYVDDGAPFDPGPDGPNNPPGGGPGGGQGGTPALPAGPGGAPGGGFAPGSAAAPGSAPGSAGGLAPSGGFAPGSAAVPSGGFAPGSAAAPGGGFAPGSAAVPGGGFAPGAAAGPGAVPSSAMVPSSGTAWANPAGALRQPGAAEAAPRHAMVRTSSEPTTGLLVVTAALVLGAACFAGRRETFAIRGANNRVSRRQDPRPKPKGAY